MADSGGVVRLWNEGAERIFRGVFVQFSVTLLRDDADRVTGIAAIMRDVTRDD